MDTPMELPLPPDGIEIDGTAMDTLVVLFEHCAKADIQISPHLPLATPAMQREACFFLGRCLTETGVTGWWSE